MLGRLSFPEKTERYRADKIFCHHSRVKQFIWSALAYCVDEVSEDNLYRIHRPKVLDAACSDYHCRSIFTPNLQYVGFDLSFTRLQAMLSRKLAEDILLKGNLVEFYDSLISQFDLVVSTNTLSHLSERHISKAIGNLSAYTMIGGTLFFNVRLFPGIGSVISSLCSVFDDVEVMFCRLKTKMSPTNIIPVDDYSDVKALVRDTFDFELNWSRYAARFEYDMVVVRALNKSSVDQAIKRLPISGTWYPNRVNILPSRLCSQTSPIFMESEEKIISYFHASEIGVHVIMPIEFDLLFKAFYGMTFTEATCSSRLQSDCLSVIDYSTDERILASNIKNDQIFMLGFESEIIGANEGIYSIIINDIRSLLGNKVSITHLISNRWPWRSKTYSASCLQRD